MKTLTLMVTALSLQLLAGVPRESRAQKSHPPPQPRAQKDAGAGSTQGQPPAQEPAPAKSPPPAKGQSPGRGGDDGKDED